ncbi:uncharacterized protein [Drosophila kikkawai]|uniref:Uncharacterized protein n=1 Tax=Drosophila kikkawai TaxID=30033 RepID=A0A6P4HQ06_DROKI|nr:uncharacterized protein LOC108071415 [Drosophila kikkawai]
MPPFRTRASENNNVRAGYVGEVRGRGRGRGRAGRRLRRLAPLAIRGPPDGDSEQANNSAEPTVASQADPIPHPEVPQQAQNSPDESVATEDEHVAIPEPLALPEGLQRANFPRRPSPESG